MATEPERWTGGVLPHVRIERQRKVTPQRQKDLFLCVAFVVLLLWALGVGLGLLK